MLKNGHNRSFTILFVCLFSYFSKAQTLLVPTEHSTIQDAINFSVNGDVIIVSSGTYNENINFLGKSIVLESELGALQTVIDGGAIDSVVTFTSNETNEAVLRGFTITNGNSSEGGGIKVYNSSPIIEKNIITMNFGCTGAGVGLGFASPIIRDNEITSNEKAGCSGGIGGGGISIRGAASSHIINNTISNNISTSGAAIAMFAAGNPTIRNNRIYENTSYGNGGAMSLVNRSDAVIEQNLIYGNSASRGGAIYWLVPSGNQGPKLINNTFAENSASQFGSTIFADGYDRLAQLTNNIIVASSQGVAIYCGSLNDVNPPQFYFNNVYSEDSDSFSGLCSDQAGINGNISTPPMFSDVTNDDFRLLAGSQAIDSGKAQASITEDILGYARPVDGDNDGTVEIDLGVYESYRPEASAGNDFVVEINTVGVELDGSGSADTDGIVSTYFWEQVEGQGVNLSDSSIVKPKFDAPSSSTPLFFKLTVTDDLGFQDTDEILVTVNEPPVSNPGSDLNVNTGSNVTLDGSGSTDDMGVHSYNWAQESGTQVSLANANQAKATFSAPDAAGVLIFRLTVQDEYGLKNTGTLKVTVASPPKQNQSGGGGSIETWFFFFFLLFGARKYYSTNVRLYTLKTS